MGLKATVRQMSDADLIAAHDRAQRGISIALDLGFRGAARSDAREARILGREILARKRHIVPATEGEGNHD